MFPAPAPLDPALAVQRIRELARAHGFQRCGIAGIELGEDEAHLADWLGKGLYGTMDWMARNVELRNDPAALLPGTVRVLSVGLDYIDEETEMRRAIAKRYLTEITNPLVKLPEIRENTTHVYHIFAILCEKRDEMMQFLAENGVQAGIHYPIPPHLSPCYAFLGYKKGDFPVGEYDADHQISLPIYAGMPDEEVSAVIAAVNAFRG